MQGGTVHHRNHDREGEAILRGQDMLAGELESFELEYPCHAPHEERWFELSVRPVEGISAYVLERELGGGGMSHVFVAREEPSGATWS